MPSSPWLRWLFPPAPSVPGVVIGVETCRIPLRLVCGDSSTSRDGDASRVSESLGLTPLASTTRRLMAGILVPPPGKIRASVELVRGRTLLTLYLYHYRPYIHVPQHHVARSEQPRCCALCGCCLPGGTRGRYPHRRVCDGYLHLRRRYHG